MFLITTILVKNIQYVYGGLEMSNNKKKSLYFGYQPKEDISKTLKPPRGWTGEVDPSIKMESAQKENEKSKK